MGNEILLKAKQAREQKSRVGHEKAHENKPISEFINKGSMKKFKFK